MKLLAQLALIGTTFGQPQVQGPPCTAYKMELNGAGGMSLMSILMSEEVPTTESGKHEFIREHLYDTSKGECADGESCSLIMAEPPI